MGPEPHSGLDASVGRALEVLWASGVQSPDVLLFAATGANSIVRQLSAGVRLALVDVDGVPPAFAGASLTTGTLDGVNLWVVEDAPRSPQASEDAWGRAFPIWLAASAGAPVVVHLSAGTAVRGLRPGTVARLTDHINLSGTSPLTGLGESKLGPLFPDQTRLHDEEFGALAHACAERLGLALEPAVAACTVGPALSTPAELRSFAALGADVAVQRLADPLLAAAHAGSIALALVAITDDASEHLGVAELVARAAETAPKLEALALECLRNVAPVVARKRDEASV